MTEAASPPPVRPHSQREILRLWWPLAATWLMMALEGPFLAAVIARIAEAKFNLAAHGVAYAFALLVEAPVIMLMSASTALVKDAVSFRRLHRFTWVLNGGATALLLLVLAPPVHDFATETLLGLPPEVAHLTYGALWLFLPWPGAIGYRRFVQGLLIRAGRTRLVALGTVLRLLGMAAAGLGLYFLGSLPGAWVGAAALSTGVITEAVAAHLMARKTVDELRATPAGENATLGSPSDVAPGTVTEPGSGASVGPADEPHAATGADGRATETPKAVGAELEYREILRFYYPLALTSIIGLTVQPLLTFFMGRAPAPIESLAVFPVVYGLAFIFRAPGLSFQEAAIALLGDRNEHWPELRRFATWMGLATTGLLTLVGFTPLADVWFVTVSGLSPELANFALVPTRILAPLPALTVLLSLQRAVLVQLRRTRPITVASALEVAAIAALFSLLGWVAGLVGVTAAALAFVAGRLGGNAYLARPVMRGLESGARAHG